MKKAFVLGVLLSVLGLGAGCAQALIIPAAAAGAVYADKKVCEKKGIEAPKVDPDLKRIIDAIKDTDEEK